MTRLLTLALVAALLAACGGGDDGDDRKTTEPVDCRLQPEKCA